MGAPPALLLDTFGLFFRAFFALPSMSTSRGEATGALYGFSSLLLKLLREHPGSALCFALDTGRPTFRHREFQPYKAGRAPTPTPLVEQLRRLDGLLEAVGAPVLGMPGDFKYATALLILILLLLVRPQGLLGKPQRVG